MTVSTFLRNPFILLLVLSFFVSCDDNDPEAPENGSNISLERTASLNILTNNGATKTWKIESATLTNSSGSFDISENFNVKDDEFRFSGGVTDGNLEWRPRHRINTAATTATETLVDHYLSPENFSFSFDSDSSNALSSFNGDFTFTIIYDNSITGRIALDDNTTELEIALIRKTTADFPSIPTSTLDFENVFSYNSNSIQGFAPGMIGSYSDNSLFIVNREDAFNANGINPERIVKYDLDTNQSSEKLFFNSDFVSKQLHIVDNELLVVGGQFINNYDLTLLNEPISINHDIEHFCSNFNESISGITRHGMAVQNDDIYIIGGSTSNSNSPSTGQLLCGDIFSNIIYRWNLETQILEEFTTLPDTSFWGRGTIVNDHLYVFGGRQFFFGDAEVYDTIHVINLNTQEIETLNLPSPMEMTFVDKLDNLIYVAGNNDIRDADGVIIGSEYSLGVFDTETNTYTSLDTNLVQENPFDTIHQMCIFNNDMYILWGSIDSNNDPNELDSWDILRVPIN